MKRIKLTVLLCVAMFGAGQILASNSDNASQYAEAYKAICDSTIKNDKVAVAVLSDLADKDYPQAVAAMGLVYRDGISVTPDYDKAKAYYNKAINLGVTGLDCYLRDCEKRKAYATRINQIRQGVKSGDAKACGDLGWCYANGVVVYFDNERAVECFKLGAEKNDPQSMYELGIRYFIGYGVEQDINKAVKLMEKAAKGGNADAQYQMALMNDEATPIAKNDAVAVAWYDKAMAQNHADALYNGGLQYLNGSLRTANKAKAMECLLKSSNLGNANAAYLIGTLYCQGKVVSADFQKALKYFQLAYSRGYDLAAVEAGKVCMLINNKAKAKEWFGKAAQLGLNQGEYYTYVINNTTDIKALEKKSKDGDVEATKLLAVCYHEGFGVKKDDKKAFNYIKKAADDDRDACYQLAQYYVNGIGVKKDYKKAVEYFKKYDNLCAEIAIYSNAKTHQEQLSAYRKAAAGGNAEAYFMLHLCYENGCGVEANEHMAHQMLVNSASLGHEMAQRKVAAYWSAKNDSFSAVKADYWNAKYQGK